MGTFPRLVFVCPSSGTRREGNVTRGLTREVIVPEWWIGRSRGLVGDLCNQRGDCLVFFRKPVEGLSFCNREGWGL